MAKVLVIWKANWADEMDIEGFKIYDEADWKSYETELKARERKFDIYIGTNEEIRYDDGKDLLNSLKVKKITDDEAKTIKKLFGDEFGFTQFSSVYLDEEIEEEDIEEDNWLTQDEEY
jgi:hypothetical protein